MVQPQILGVPAVGPIRRTRVLNVRQSKNGCFTCKARRVKCDETRPTCLRCSRSEKSCAGYGIESAEASVLTPEATISTVSSSPTSNVCTIVSGVSTCTSPVDLMLWDSIWQSSEQSHLVALGCFALGNDPFREEFGIDTAIWKRLLPHLSHTVPVVNKAVAAFGAVYGSRFLSQDSMAAGIITTVPYNAAIRALQQELLERPNGTVPIVMACVLLACTEVLQRRPRHAHTHLHGALRVLETQENTGLASAFSVTSTPDDQSVSLVGSEADATNELVYLLRSLDLQASSYVLSHPPTLPSVTFDQFTTTRSKFESVKDASIQLTQLLHSSLHFTSMASAWKYMPPSSISRDMSIEQGRHIAKLSLWLKNFNERLFDWKQTLTKTSMNSYRHALMIRAQCLIGIIYVSTILSPYETEYDRYASSFQQIIEDATAILIDDQEAASTSAASHFRPGLGIIQPLLFTALKYRHSHWRRRALALLLETGVEGPWFGRVEAAVAKRAMQAEEEDFEEQFCAINGVLEILPEQIQERKRICGVGLADPDDAADDGLVKISLSRCVDVEYMISGEDHYSDAKHWILWETEVSCGPLFKLH